MKAKFLADNDNQNTRIPADNKNTRIPSWLLEAGKIEHNKKQVGQAY